MVKRKIIKRIRNMALVLTAVLVSITLWFGYNLFSIWHYSSSKCTNPSGAIVVMGAAEYNGIPSKVLSARINTAALLFQRGVGRYVIALGGSRPGDVYSEAQVGKVALIRDSVPKARVFSSANGQDTYQSLLSASALLRRLKVEKIIVVSDGFHLYRSVHIAATFGLTACGYAASGSPIQGNLKTEYMLREAVAVTVAQVIGYKEESLIRHGR